MSLQTPHVLADGQGEYWDFLNCHFTVKVDRATSGGAMTVIDALMPRGFGPPLHRHDVEDEFFHVTEGRLWISAGGQETVLEPGGSVWLPKGLPHVFQCVADEGPTRMIQISTPAQFEEMVAKLGAPAPAPRLPDPVEIDPGHVAAVCAEFDIEILGPPPAPLD